MLKNSKLTIAAGALICLFGVLIYRQQARLAAPTTAVVPPTQPTTCIPTFQDGGGPYYEEDTPVREMIAPADHAGTELTVRGRVLAADCVTPLANHTVDIWQANESGNYDDTWYRGRVTTEGDGSYQFTTVVPKGYGEGTAFRPPHIHFKIWNGQRLLITSQMFLPESRAQGIEEAYIMEVSQNDAGSLSATHDIIVP